MKLNLVTTKLLAVSLFLFPEFIAFSQVSEKHPDSFYANSHVAGVGTKSIVYHLDKPIDSKLVSACSDYITKNKHVITHEISDSEIKMEFQEVTSNEMIYYFIQRLEMYFIYNPRKTQQ